MIDSYQAPADLAQARKKSEAVVAGRQASPSASADLSPSADADDRAVVTLTGKRFDRTSSLGGAEVVIADLVLWRWDEASLRSLAKKLPPGAMLVFLEPTADLGWRRGLHRMTKNLWWAALRHNFESDVPARLRAAGLLVTTTDRFSVGPAGIRSYVWGIAEHLQPSDGPDGS